MKAGIRLVRGLSLIVAASGCLVFYACERDSFIEPPSPSPDAFPITLPPGWPAIIWPADNPYSHEKAELGKALFFDTRLSRDGVISCSWCHSERASFADNHSEPFSTGVYQLPTRRNTPTVVNVAFGNSFMLSGDFATLELQAVAPLLNPHEMGMTPAEIEAVIRGDSAYAVAFRKIFGPQGATLGNVAKALATFQRTLISATAPYDAWKAGDSTALLPQARRGEALFIGKAGCSRCHIPPLFTDGLFHNTGLDRVTQDSGRAGVTGLHSDLGKFKTPTLRNIVSTTPYMHDGRFRDLTDIVEHYNSGGTPHPMRDSLMKPLFLDFTEVLELVAFLHALQDQRFLDLYNP
jgi:cytochrome c peroxidase